MQTVSITNLREMTGVELVVLNEAIEITSNKTTIGYFVPAVVWEILRVVIVGAEWNDADELGREALDIMQATTNQEPTDG
jgi:hypothetical protein